MARYSKNEAMDWARANLRGEWTTLMTPFTPDDTLDEEGLRRNIRYIRRLGTTGGGCTWGMGEFWSLTQEEKFRVMETVADEAAGRWLIAAHVTDTSAKNMLAQAKRAEALGFDLLVVAAPYIVTKTEDQVVEFTRLLATNTSLAIMFYNSPQFGIVMSPQGLKRLVSIPNVVGVKEASFSQQTSIETHLLLGKQAIISTPDEWIFPKAKELGFEQQVMFANTSDWRFDTPEANHYVRFIDRATRGDLDLNYYNTHLKAIKELSDAWWGRTVKKFGGALPVSMVKYWGELMGLSHGHVRAPLANLTQDEQRELRTALAALRPVVPQGSREQPPAHANGAAPIRLMELSDSGLRITTPVPATNGHSAYTPAPANNAGMMLMVSVQDAPEAIEAERGGADIVDIKNLQEAMVGSGHPNLVREIRSMIPATKHVSVTLGVVPNQPGTVAMAVYSAAMLKATSVKVGFVDASYDVAVAVLRESRRALEGSETKLVGAIFADNHLYGGHLDPTVMVRLAKDGECDGWLIDTLTKDGRNLFDFIPEPKLREMVLEGKALGMSTALSGHLKLDNLDELARINPDIVGVRGAVCSTGDRNRAVAWEAVAHFKRELDRRKSGEIDVRAQRNGHTLVDGTRPKAGGWAIIDGRGKTCAGVIAAISRQVDHEPNTFVEAILADALNIYDVIAWAEQAGHRLLTQRREPDGTTRVLIQP